MQKFDEVAADLQTFRSLLRLIGTLYPTGVTKAEVTSIEISKHLKMSEGMSYDAREYPNQEGRYHLSSKTLRTCLKIFERDRY